MLQTTHSQLTETLDRRRRDLGMSIDALSKLSGVSVATIKRALSGKHAGVSFGNIERIAESLDVAIDFSIAADSDEVRARQAKKKAQHIAAMVQGTSALEAQAVEGDAMRKMVERTSRELLASNRRLWS